MENLQSFIDFLTDAQEILLNLIDYSKIDNIEFDGIDHSDAPDYCDAYIISAELYGIALSEIEIDRINKNRDFVYEKLMEYLY